MRFGFLVPTLPYLHLLFAPVAFEFYSVLVALPPAPVTAKEVGTSILFSDLEILTADSTLTNNVCLGVMTQHTRGVAEMNPLPVRFGCMTVERFPAVMTLAASLSS